MFFHRYSALVGTIGKKFVKKRNRVYEKDPEEAQQVEGIENDTETKRTSSIPHKVRKKAKFLQPTD